MCAKCAGHASLPARDALMSQRRLITMGNITRGELHAVFGIGPPSNRFIGKRKSGHISKILVYFSIFIFLLRSVNSFPDFLFRNSCVDDKGRAMMGGPLAPAGLEVGVREGWGFGLQGASVTGWGGVGWVAPRDLASVWEPRMAV